MIYITDKGLDSDLLKELLQQEREFVAEGYFGIVYRIEYDGGVFAYKEFKDTMQGFIYDYEILEDLDHLPYFPSLYAFSTESWMLTEFIEGVYLKELPVPAAHSLDMLDMFRASVENGWLPLDVKGNNILVSDRLGVVVVVDVGGFMAIDHKHNVDLAQRAAWVMSNLHKYPSVCQPPP